MNPQLKQAFLARLSAMPETDPLWQGLNTLLEEILKDTVTSSSRPGQTADDRAFNDGRQSMSMDLAQVLADAWVQAHTPPG